jgi:hypothetical protein
MEMSYQYWNDTTKQYQHASLKYEPGPHAYTRMIVNIACATVVAGECIAFIVISSAPTYRLLVVLSIVVTAWLLMKRPSKSNSEKQARCH